MKRLTNLITVGNHQFNFVSEVDINSSYETYTDTCTITIPSNVKWEGKSIISGANNTIFKLGDKVKVELGYDFNNQTVFTGYLTRVKTGDNIQLICEDEMYQFKKLTYTKSFKKVSLKELVDFLLTKVKEPVKSEVTLDVQLGKFLIENDATGVQIFEELKKTYGINSFFRDGVLYVGMAYNTNNTSSYRKEKEFVFQRQIISDSLEFRTSEERKIKIHAVSIDDKNQKIEYTAGDYDGQKVDIFGYDKTQKDLKAIAEAALPKYKFTGFDGSFLTFGNPLLRHGDVASLIDLKYPERTGKYIVKEVNTTFGSNGYKQEISLAEKIS